jgi:hypothetical protein
MFYIMYYVISIVKLLALDIVERYMVMGDLSWMLSADENSR